MVIDFRISDMLMQPQKAILQYSHLSESSIGLGSKVGTRDAREALGFSHISMSSAKGSDHSSIDEERPSLKPRILYVDDEPSISKVIEYGLEKYGFEVDVYNNPASALSAFVPAVYSMLLLDVRLQGIDGLELCNQLLKIDNKVKVCFITAYELQEEELCRRVLGLQTRCIIKKPVKFDSLVSKIKTQIYGS